MLSLDGIATLIIKIGQVGASYHGKIPPHQCAEVSGIDHEDWVACRSPRGDGSVSTGRRGRDVNYADREFDLDDLVLSSDESTDSISRQRAMTGGFALILVNCGHGILMQLSLAHAGLHGCALKEAI